MTPQTATAMQPSKSSVPVQQGARDLLDQFDGIYGSIAQRAFDLFQSNGRTGRELDDWLRAEAELLHPVHMEITEADAEFIVRAEVPGFTSKELDIKVEPRSLTIAGKRETKEEKNGKKLLCDCFADQILRGVELPSDVDTSKVTATLKDGILTVELPKAANTKAIRVEAKSA